MKSIVVDAHVAVKWFLPEDHSAEAQSVLDGYVLHCPDLILIEVANVLRGRVLATELKPEHARNVLKAFGHFPMHLTLSSTLILTAWEIAIQTSCSVYDSIYVALAQQMKCPLVTSDQKLIRKLMKTEYAKSVVWLPHLKSGT